LKSKIVIKTGGEKLIEETKYELIMRLPVLIIAVFTGLGLILLLVSGSFGYLALTINALLNPLNWFWFLCLSISLILLLECLRSIPATPPHVGLVTIKGKRIPKILSEGWHLFWPFFPFWYDAITVNVEKKNVDFHPKNVRTSDKAELTMEISVTYSPNKKKPEALIEYINTGGAKNVNNILEDIIEERSRLFAIKKTWADALEAGEDVIKHLIQEIAKARTDITIERIRKGNGIAQIPGLGIVLHRFNIGTIWLKGRLAERAELEAVEKREMDAEKVELTHVKERAKEMQELGLTPKDAVEIVQTERGKVTKTITEIKGLEQTGGFPIITIGGKVPSKPREGKKKKRGQ